MALSQEVMFRQKALDILQKNDMKFPYFPWVCFEMELRRCMEFGTVYNLATVKAWVRLKEQRYRAADAFQAVCTGVLSAREKVCFRTY